MSPSISNAFCTFALLISLLTTSCAQEGPGAISPFPEDTGKKSDHSVPLDALQLTKGEWKRSIEDKRKINPPMPEQARQKRENAVASDQKEPKKPANYGSDGAQDVEVNLIKEPSSKQCPQQPTHGGDIEKKMVFVTSTSTVDCLPITVTISANRCDLVPIQCSARPITIVTENVTITEYEPEIITHFHEIYSTKTCSTLVTCTHKCHTTVTHSTTATLFETVSFRIQETMTHHTTIPVYQPCEEVAVTLTSTRLSIVRVHQSTTNPILICTTIAPNTLNACDCSCLNKPKVKKVILRIPKCKRNCKQVPWWMKNLTPKYDYEKAFAYKKQIYEGKHAAASKCAAVDSPDQDSKENQTTCTDASCAVKPSK